MPGEWIFLYGPPGSGKSSVGKLLAEALCQPFVDLDAEIEQAAGIPINQIFATQGESAFRKLEKQVLLQRLEAPVGVMALGGGSLLDESSRKMVETHGPVVCLSAPIGVLARRLELSQAKRPLLAGNLQKQLESLLRQRADHYTSFSIQYNENGLPLEATAWSLQKRLGRFHVSGMGKGYEVRIDNGCLEQLGEGLQRHGLRSPLVVIADENVARLYASQVMRSLATHGFRTGLLIFPAGEMYKTLSTVQQVWDGCLQHGLERGGTVIALGGGVVSDVAGFAAATFMRGVDWVAVPTTLLAMADASLGGKTGVDLPRGKNLVGAFYPPRLVWSDPNVLATLPEPEVRSGLAEVVKAGIVGDQELFAACAVGIEALSNRWMEIITQAAAVKVRLVEQDPYEKGVREALNLGHTIGHALERVLNYEISHGEAVSIGLVTEARLAEGTGIAPKDLATQIAKALETLKLPVEIPAGVELQALISAMQVDKKRREGELICTLPETIGKVRTGVHLTPDQILSMLKRSPTREI